MTFMLFIALLATFLVALSAHSALCISFHTPRVSKLLFFSSLLPPSFLPPYFFVAVIGGVSEVISSLNARHHKFRRKMEMIKAFMVSKKVPRDLQTRVIDYFDHVWARQGDDDASILSELPHHLRTVRARAFSFRFSLFFFSRCFFFGI